MQIVHETYPCIIVALYLHHWPQIHINVRLVVIHIQY